MRNHYDILIAGTGLYGDVFAHEALKRGKSVLMLEKRSHIGGNIYTEKRDGITIHCYGAHIFHTSDKEIWDYVTGLVHLCQNVGYFDTGGGYEDYLGAEKGS